MLAALPVRVKPRAARRLLEPGTPVDTEVMTRAFVREFRTIMRARRAMKLIYGLRAGMRATSRVPVVHGAARYRTSAARGTARRPRSVRAGDSRVPLLSLSPSRGAAAASAPVASADRCAVHSQPRCRAGRSRGVRTPFPSRGPTASDSGGRSCFRCGLRARAGTARRDCERQRACPLAVSRAIRQSCAGRQRLCSMCGCLFGRARTERAPRIGPSLSRSCRYASADLQQARAA